MRRRLKKAGGNWVTGEQFFGREGDLRVLAERVREGSHTLLSGPRRIGKTSLVRELLRRLEESDGFKSAFVDLEAVANPPEAIATIASQSVPRRHAFKELFFNREIKAFGLKGIRVESRRNVGEHNWRAYGDRALRSLARDKRPVVLAVDELSIFVNRILKGSNDQGTRDGRYQADLFLSWLRKNAQTHQGRLRLIVTGSVGLEPILSRANLGALVNAYEPYVLRPWSQHEASDCLAALALQYDLQLPIESRRAMCERLRSCVPHHVQQFFSRMQEHLEREGRTRAEAADVEAVYRKDMLSIGAQAGLDHHQGRLKDVFEPTGYKLSISLLTAAACNRGILGREAARRCVSQLAMGKDEALSLYDDVMRQLLHDGYLERIGGDYRFVSKLVEDWWRIRHCETRIYMYPWHASN